MGRLDDLLWRFGTDRHRRAVVRNLALPAGWLGRRVGRNLAKANQTMNVRVVQAIAPKPGEIVLEVGHGPGAAFPLVLATAPDVVLIGADPSDEMVRTALASNADAASSGRLTVHHAPTEKLPLEDDSVDAVLGNNVVYFWRDPSIALRELRRVLRPSGRLAIGYRPRSSARQDVRDLFDKAGHQLYDVEQVEAMLLAAGFRNPSTTIADSGEAITTADAPEPTPPASDVTDEDLERPMFVVE